MKTELGPVVSVFLCDLRVSVDAYIDLVYRYKLQPWPSRFSSIT